jgi:hypothetical protein
LDHGRSELSRLAGLGLAGGAAPGRRPRSAPARPRRSGCSHPDARRVRPPRLDRGAASACLFSHTLERLRERMLALGAAEDDIKGTRRLLSDPDTGFRTPSISTGWGRRAATRWKHRADVRHQALTSRVDASGHRDVTSPHCQCDAWFKPRSRSSTEAAVPSGSRQAPAPDDERELRFPTAPARGRKPSHDAVRFVCSGRPLVDGRRGTGCIGPGCENRGSASRRADLGGFVVAALGGPRRTCHDHAHHDGQTPMTTKHLRRCTDQTSLARSRTDSPTRSLNRSGSSQQR